MTSAGRHASCRPPRRRARRPPTCDEAGAARYCLTNFASVGHLVSLSFHHTRRSRSVSRGARAAPTCSASSRTPPSCNYPLDVVLDDTLCEALGHDELRLVHVLAGGRVEGALRRALLPAALRLHSAPAPAAPSASSSRCRCRPSLAHRWCRVGAQRTRDATRSNAEIDSRTSRPNLACPRSSPSAGS